MQPGTPDLDRANHQSSRTTFQRPPPTTTSTLRYATQQGTRTPLTSVIPLGLIFDIGPLNSLIFFDPNWD